MSILTPGRFVFGVVYIHNVSDVRLTWQHLRAKAALCRLIASQIGPLVRPILDPLMLSTMTAILKGQARVATCVDLKSTERR